jgi:hypothetical protein
MEFIPSGATHKNPLICKSQCQYVRIERSGLYSFWDNDRWTNVNNYMIKDMSHLIEIKR